MANAETGCWQGGLAVFLPLPVQNAWNTLQPVKASAGAKGSWLQLNGTCTMLASLDVQQQRFRLRIKLPGKSAAHSLELDLFDEHCTFRLLQPAVPVAGHIQSSAVLLLACHPSSGASSSIENPGVCQRSQVVAFRFSSLLDAQALARMVHTAQHPPQHAPRDQPTVHTEPKSAATQRPSLPAQPPLTALLTAPDCEAQLQRMLENYLAEPGFMDLVDRLEKVYEKMEQQALDQRDIDGPEAQT